MVVEEGALREEPSEGGALEPAPPPPLPPALGSLRSRWAVGGSWGGQRRRAEGSEVGTPGQPGAPLPGLIPRTHSLSHRPRSEPGESWGSVLRGDSPPQGALRFSGRTRPLRSRAGGVRQRWRGNHRLQGPEAAGWGGLVCGGAGPSHPILPLEAAGIAPSPRQSQAGRRRGLSERLWGGQWWVPPQDPSDHCSGAGPTPGPLRPPLRGGSTLCFLSSGSSGS